MNRWIRIIGSLLVVAVMLNNASAQQDPFGDAQPAAGAAPNQDNFPGFGQQAPSTLTPEQQAQQEQLIQQINTLNGQAAALAEQGDLDGAIAKYDEANATAANFDSLYQKGRLLQELGYAQDALAAFGAAGSYTPQLGGDKTKLLPFLIDLGKAYLEAEQYNTAIQVFTSGIQQLGNNAELWFNKGVAEAEFAKNQQFSTPQSRQEDIQKALDSFDRAIRINDQYAEAYFERGMTHSLLNDIDTAIEDFETSVQLDPTNTDALARLGLASLNRGFSESLRPNGQKAKIDRDLRQAVTQMTRFLDVVPARQPGEEDDGVEIGREDILLQRSATYIALGDEEAAQGDSSEHYRNAIADADAVIELEPDAPDGFFQKAIALRMLGDMDGALEALSDTLARSPGNYQALLRRGIIRFRQNDLESAMVDLKKALRFTGGFNAPAHFWLGLCYSTQDDANNAVRHYSFALKYAPNFATAQFNRGLEYMKLGRFERAREDFGEVFRQDTKNSQARTLRDQAAKLMRR